MSETVGAALERALRLYPGREAVVDGDMRWSYSELHQKVAGFDAALDSLGLAKGDVVAVLGLNSAAHLVAWLAIPRSGRILNDLNFRLSPAELRLIVEDSGARTLLVGDAFLEAGSGIANSCPSIEHLIYIGERNTPPGWLSFSEMAETEGRPLKQVDEDAVAGIFYTGGTSGLPKGVMLTHRNLVANAKHALIMLGYDASDTYLHAAPMFHLALGEERFRDRLRSAGRPIIGVEVDIRRADGTRAVIGEAGEIWVRGPNIMKGYWNRPDESSAALDNDRWYHSGDAAYQDADGYIFVVDRIKDMIISGGENVYCVEVENAIYQHAAVLECAVFGIPDTEWGEQVHAAIVLKPGTAASEEEIVDHCRGLIAGYKLPRSIGLRAESLPKSGAGKILKRTLREPFWQSRERQIA
jgi:acyl-CoA synthetase (AMP-forming)/AMP-acid ligase II